MSDIYPSWSEEGINFEVVQGAFGSCSSRAPGGQGMHWIILVLTIKITFQKAPENFACLCVCVSVGLCVCVSWCLLLQSQITFDSFVGWQKNFQGLLNSLRVIFGQVIWTSGPPGSGPDPKKGGFSQIYLLQWVRFHVCKIRVGNLGVMHKTKIKGGHQTLTFSFMQLFNTMHPGGATTTSTATNFSLQCFSTNFKIFDLLPLWSQASDQSFRHKKYLRISLCFWEMATQSFKTLKAP